MSRKIVSETPLGDPYPIERLRGVLFSDIIFLSKFGPRPIVAFPALILETCQLIHLLIVSSSPEMEIEIGTLDILNRNPPI